MSNTRELVLYDGPDDLKTVFVYDNPDIHYFYWPIELTPLGIIKKNDVEPLKETSDSHISRLHYNGMIIWLKSKTDDPKKICYFTKNYHTPIIIMNNKSTKTLKLQDYNEIKLKERIPYWLGKWWFGIQIEISISNNARSYSNKISKIEGKDVLDEKEIYDKSYVEKHVKELIIIGDKKSIEKYIKKIEKKVKPLNAKEISKYLKF